jgi:hypothetical protein
VFDYLQPIADTPLVRFDRPLVVRIRDRATRKGHRFANYEGRALHVFAWGAERGYLKTNPAERIKDVRRKKGTPDANRPWSDEERHAVLDATPPHIKAATAVMMFTGLGPKDALTLPRSFYKPDAVEIATRRSKTGEPVFWPAPSSLAAVLAETPPHAAVTLLANSEGRPWTESGFRASWRPCRLKLEAAGPDRSRPHPVRLAAHRRDNPAGDRLRSPNDRRRPRPEDDGHGGALLQAGRSQAEDGRCGPGFRRRSEQAANENCQTGGLKRQTSPSRRATWSEDMKPDSDLSGSGGGTRTPDTRIMIPLL